jgi:hypothetical protein
LNENRIKGNRTRNDQTLNLIKQACNFF